SNPSPALDPEPQFPATPEPMVEPATIAEPAESSGNLFAGTQASETTVEQLLADGANLSAVDSDPEADVTVTVETPSEITARSAFRGNLETICGAVSFRTRTQTARTSDRPSLGRTNR
ncbi:MAG: hypothetical protein AAFY21_22705, partial [Cyanobacteria bacterium J06641_2]